jgi:Rad3-related DNA helicase
MIVDGVQELVCNDVCGNFSCDKCKGWYNAKTASDIIQMSGRVVRNKDDWAMIYIMDLGFKRFFNTHKYLFPKYFQEAIEWWKK